MNGGDWRLRRKIKVGQWQGVSVAMSGSTVVPWETAPALFSRAFSQTTASSWPSHSPNSDPPRPIHSSCLS